jgi:hypothetical protein
MHADNVLGSKLDAWELPPPPPTLPGENDSTPDGMRTHIPISCSVLMHPLALPTVTESIECSMHGCWKSRDDALCVSACSAFNCILCVIIPYQHSYQPMCMLVTVVIFELLYAELMDMIAFPVSVGMLTVLLSDQITRDPCDMCTLLWFIAFVLPSTNMFITSVYVRLCYVHLDYNCTTSIDDRIESLN